MMYANKIYCSKLQEYHGDFNQEADIGGHGDEGSDQRFKG